MYTHTHTHTHTHNLAASRSDAVSPPIYHSVFLSTLNNELTPATLFNISTAKAATHFSSVRDIFRCKQLCALTFSVAYFSFYKKTSVPLGLCRVCVCVCVCVCEFAHGFPSYGCVLSCSHTPIGAPPGHKDFMLLC